MSNKTARELHEAATNLEIRSAVQSTLSSLLTDIELSQTLQTSLSTHTTISKLQHDLTSTQSQLQELQAVRQEEIQKNRKLGDVFVSELLVLSVKLGELEEFYSENRNVVKSLEDAKVRLARAEEVVRTMKMRKSLNQNYWEEGEHENKEEHENEKKEEVDYDASAVSSGGGGEVEGKEEVALEKEQTSSSSFPDAGGGGGTSTTDVNTPPVAEKHQTSPTTAVTTTTTASTIQTASTSPSAAEEDKAPSFEDIDETTLMTIFAYLDPYDILSTAQVNVTLYSMVDSLFGLGGGGVGGSSEDEEEEEEEEEGGDAVVAAEEEEDVKSSATATTASATTATVASVPAPATTTTAATAASGSKAAATVVPASTATTAAIPSTTKVTNTTAATAAAPSTTTTTTGGPASGFFSMLQPKQKQSTAATPTPTTTSTSKPTAIPASAINSFASKLTQSELQIIISMQENYRTKVKEVERLQIEKEDLAARLEGTEEVKEFLIKKLRDVERSNKSHKEDSMKITQQVASDQEVISFLDGRVQELEYKVQTLERSNAEELKSKEQYTSSTEKKISVLSDMLQFEREQMKSMEKEWKNTKKVLVKEVKHCRAQIVALQAERDSYYHTNLKLKDALLSLHGGKGGEGGGGDGDGDGR